MAYKKVLRHTKTVLLIFILIFVIIYMRVWNIFHVFQSNKDSHNGNKQDLLKDVKTYDKDFDEDGSTDKHPKYQDEDFTEEEIKLFGPLEEREVRYKIFVWKLIFFINNL